MGYPTRNLLDGNPQEYCPPEDDALVEARCMICNVPIPARRKFCSEEHRRKYHHGMRRLQELNHRREVNK